MKSRDREAKPVIARGLNSAWSFEGVSAGPVTAQFGLTIRTYAAHRLGISTGTCRSSYSLDRKNRPDKKSYIRVKRS